MAIKSCQPIRFLIFLIPLHGTMINTDSHITYNLMIKLYYGRITIQMGHQSLTSKNCCFLSVALKISTAQFMLYFKQLLSENYLLVCNKPN